MTRLADHIDLDQVEETPWACEFSTRRALVAATRALLAVVERMDLTAAMRVDELNEPWASALKAAAPPFLPGPTDDHRDPVRHARLLPHHPRHPLLPHPRAGTDSDGGRRYRRHGWTHGGPGPVGRVGRRGLEAPGGDGGDRHGHADPVLHHHPHHQHHGRRDPDDAADARDMGETCGSTPPLWPTATRRRRGPSSTSR